MEFMIRAFLAALLAVSSLSSQVQIEVTSTAVTGTTTWATVPVPWQEAQALVEPLIFDAAGRQWRAVRGPEVGRQTVFYDLFIGNLPANTTLSGELKTAPADWPNFPPYIPHEWVADDMDRLTPGFLLTMGNGVVHQSPPVSPIVVFDTPARQTWAMTTRVGPLVIHWWANIWHRHPVVEWQALAVFSDPSIQAMQITVQRLQMTLGEPFVIDDALPLGISAPLYDSQKDAWSVDLVGAPIAMGDAQGLPVFRGAILATDSTRPWYYHLLTPDPQIRARVNQLLARGGGQSIGTTDWAGRWLAFQSTIGSQPADGADIAGRLQRQSDFMAQTQNLYAPRLLGLNPNAGSTGAQEDFGVSRGAELYLGEPRFARTWGYHQQAALRPMHYRELDGSQVTQQPDHPQWWTWSQLTHWNGGVSPDRLGKPVPVPPYNTHAFGGKDDQHLSSNGLHAIVAAFDWPAYRRLVDDEIAVAMANVRLLPAQSAGAPRAIGRRMLADSNRWLLTGREEVWSRLVVGFGKKAYELAFTPLPDFRLTGWHVTDPRVLVDVNGDPVPAIVVWQEGLAMNGLAAGWAAHLYRTQIGIASHPDTHLIGDLLVEVATTIVRHYFAQNAAGDWQFFLNVAWTGDYPDPEIIGGDTDVVGVVRDRQEVQGSGWFDWLGPGLYYLYRANHGLEVPIDVQLRLQSIFQEWEAEVLPGSSIQRREWFAVVDANAPPPPINRPPQVDIQGPTELAVGAVQDYLAVVTDPDGDPITFDWANMGQAGELITVRADAPGEVTLTVTVSDGRSSSTSSVTIIVR
jgi:hypothetical protein